MVLEKRESTNEIAPNVMNIHDVIIITINIHIPVLHQDIARVLITFKSDLTRHYFEEGVILRT